MQELQDISKNELSKIVKLAIEKSSFKYLIWLQKQKQKGRDIMYTKLGLQPYMISRENLIQNHKEKHLHSERKLII